MKYSIITFKNFVFAYVDKQGSMTKSQLNKSEKQGYEIYYFVNKEDAQQMHDTITKLF